MISDYIINYQLFGGILVKREIFKKGWFWCLMAGLFLVIVQIIFTIKAPCKWLAAVWEAGDLITFVGTIALGIVAFMQAKDANKMTEKANEMTKRANEMSERLMTLEEERNRLELLPCAMLVDWKADTLKEAEMIFEPQKIYIQVGNYDRTKDSILGISLFFLNTTNSYISVEYNGAKSKEFDWSSTTMCG